MLRRIPFVVLLAWALGIGVACADDPSILQPERLIKCEAKLPDKRDHYPASWGKTPPPVKISGYDFLVAFVGTGTKGVLAQKVVRRESQCPCDETGVKGENKTLDSTLFEIFKDPVYDVQAAHVLCLSCSTIQKEGWAGRIDLPGALPKIADGENATAIFSSKNTKAGKYFDQFPAAGAEKVKKRFEDEATLHWKLYYEYDNCTKPPGTSCKKAQCLKYEVQTRPDPSAPWGAWHVVIQGGAD